MVLEYKKKKMPLNFVDSYKNLLLRVELAINE